jgi:tetratricopeptide (TPR) repeat protein
MKIFKIIFASLMISVYCYSQSAEVIEKLLVFEKFNEAKKTALSWVQKEPTNAEAYFGAGKVFLAVKNVDSASLFFDKGFEVNPKFPYNLAGKISVAFLKNNSAAVPALVEQAKDIASKKDARIYIELAAAYLYAPEAERAKLTQFTDEAMKYDRKNYHIYLILGDYYYTQPQFTSQAVDNYQRAIDNNKGALRAYVQRGGVYDYVDNFTEALAQYRKAIDADPTYPVVYLKLAEMFYRAKDWVRADTTFDLYVKYAEPSLDKLKRSVLFSYSAKNYKGAIEKINNVLSIDPKDALDQRLLGYSYFELNDSVNALAALEVFLKNPDSVKVAKDYEKYGKLLQKFGKDSLAIIAYKNAVAKDSTRGDLLSEAGKMLIKQKKWKEAIVVLAPRVNHYQDADFYDYLFLGQAYYFDSTFQESKTAFEKMTVKFPKAFAGYLWLSRACVAINPDAKEGLAKPAYEKVIELLTDKVKYKQFLVDAHSYLGVYYYKNEDKEKSKAEWTIVSDIDPTNQQAVEFLKILNK